jgi:hypothetical protein
MPKVWMASQGTIQRPELVQIFGIEQATAPRGARASYGDPGG